MDVARRLEVVEQENVLLRERVASLEAILMETVPLPLEWALTPAEARVFGVLVRRELATREAIMAALYDAKPSDQEVADVKITDVFVCKIRKKLKPYGISIHVIWGRGYRLDPEVRERFRPNTARAA